MASTSFFKHKGVRWVTAGWIGFITENLVMSHNREWIISNFGDDEYHIAYNILSTAACSSIALGYFKYGKLGGALLARKGPVLQFLGFGVQALGLAGFSQLAPALQVPVGFGEQHQEVNEVNSVNVENSKPKASERKLYVRCPIDFRHPKSEAGEIFGVERISRHPTLWFLGFTALGQAMTTVYPTSAVVFTFPIIFAYIGGAHQDYRYRRGEGGILTPERENVTSNIPFLAMIEGKQSFSDLAKEVKWTNAAGGVLIAALFALKRL